MAKAAPNPEDQKFNPGDVAALAHITTIDRRQCSRVVPMKVLALGLSRSGTASLRQALIDLGYKDCYHFSTVFQENPPDQDMWIEALEAKFEGKGKPFERADWDQLLGHCQAVTDTPCVVFYKELLEAYPEAKVILTVRDDKDQLFQSQMSTIVPYYHKYCEPATSLSTRIYRWFAPIDARAYRFFELHFGRSPMWNALLYDDRNGTESVKQWYDDYHAEIKRIVPKEKLLVMNVKEGWDPLCEFLGVEKPLYPFPRKNDTATFQQNEVVFSHVLTQIVKWNALKTTATVVAVGASLLVGMNRYGFLKT